MSDGAMLWRMECMFEYLMTGSMLVVLGLTGEGDHFVLQDKNLSLTYNYRKGGKGTSVDLVDCNVCCKN